MNPLDEPGREKVRNLFNYSFNSAQFIEADKF
jgi:hypothetical protein